MSLENEAQQPSHGESMSRRDAIIKGTLFVAGVGVTILESDRLGGLIGDGMDKVSDFVYPQPDTAVHGELHESPDTSNQIRTEMDEGTQAAIDESLHSPESVHSENPEAIDWIGTAVFSHGIRELYKGRGITQEHYFGQGALIAIKRHQARSRGDEETLHHIDEELAATINFTSIIEGTVIVAEGMLLDVESIYKRVNEDTNLQLQDRVAIVTELAAILAPMTTTVGASGMTSKEASKIVEQAQGFVDRMVDDTLFNIDGLTPEERAKEPQESVSRIKALLQSHISDKAGFPFFGDPPFIATLERFGGQGLLWQSLNVGMVPALRSLFYTNTMITKELIKLGAVSDEARPAGSIARAAMRRNFGFVSGVMGRSLKNLVTPLVGQGQDENGMQHTILRAFADKLDGFRDLVLEEHIESHGHEDEGTRIESVGKYQQFIAGVMANLPERSTEHSYERAHMQHELLQFISTDDFEGLREWMLERNLDMTIAEAFIASAREVEHEIKLQQGFDGDEVKKWNPVNVYRRVTDIPRMQAALGHSFTDVLDVFPFQSMSMIFVSPVFKYLVDKFDQATEKIPTNILRNLVNDAGKYTGITAFSSVADNLVGVREGFKFTEHNPSLALIAGIQGGMLLPPGNMANVVSFPLDEYPLEEAKSQIKPIHLQPVAEGFIWAQILGLADKLNIGPLKFPEPKTGTAGDVEHASAEAPAKAKTYSRRSLLDSLFKQTQ